MVISITPQGGCGFNLRSFNSSDAHPLSALYPFHEETPKKKLYDHWSLWRSLFEQPLDEIRDYYGESIALYFAWLEWYVCVCVCYFVVSAGVPGGRVGHNRVLTFDIYLKSVFDVTGTIVHLFFLPSWVSVGLLPK